MLKQYRAFFICWTGKDMANDSLSAIGNEHNTECATWVNRHSVITLLGKSYGCLVLPRLRLASCRQGLPL